MKVMEYREALHEASSEEQLKAIEEEVHNLAKENVKNLKRAFETNETEEAAGLTVSLQYFRKIIKELSQRRDELEAK